MTSSREIFGEFFRQEQFIVVTHFLSILNSQGYPIFGTNFPTTIFINLEIIFLIIPVLIFFNLLIQNLFKLNILKLLKLICILCIFIKITNFFKNMFFYEVLNTALVLGVWETLISILISLLFLFFINGLLIQKNHFSFLFLSFFLYALTSLFFTNDFIVLYLILELQFFSILGLILRVISKNKLNTLFIYLFINILGTIFFLFGLINVYIKTNTFNFNISFINIDGFSSFLPLGMLVKITGITTSIFFQKLYSKRFLQLYGIILILNEGGLGLISIKIFTKVLVLTDVSILIVWLFLITASAVFSTLGGLHAKNLYNILIYSAVQNGSILILPPVAGYSHSLTTAVVLYLFQYLFTTSLFLRVVQQTSTNLKKYVLFSALASIAGIPPLLGFYSKTLVLTLLITDFHYVLFFIFTVLNFISFCFYGKILIQKLLDLKHKTDTKTKFYKIYRPLSPTLMGLVLLVSCLLINQIYTIIDESYKYLISPIFHSIDLDLPCILLPIFL